ncbi:MAG: hypothetical protein KAX56_06605 [Phenylobacterium sp.]|nr:hypothetical protein [Phenylobacterium sp.]
MAWFKGYNAGAAPADQVRPFNYLLTYPTKSRMEMASSYADDLRLPQWTRRTPAAASRYSSNIADDRPEVFDRRTGKPIMF